MLKYFGYVLHIKSKNGIKPSFKFYQTHIRLRWSDSKVLHYLQWFHLLYFVKCVSRFCSFKKIKCKKNILLGAKQVWQNCVLRAKQRLPSTTTISEVIIFTDAPSHRFDRMTLTFDLHTLISYECQVGSTSIHICGSYGAGIEIPVYTCVAWIPLRQSNLVSHAWICPDSNLSGEEQERV